jgi:hypothetical protein
VGTGTVFVLENGACPHSRKCVPKALQPQRLFLQREPPPPRIRAGNRMTARKNSKTPVTAIPSSRNGSDISHTSGHNNRASKASGQQITSSKTHKRKLIIV